MTNSYKGIFITQYARYEHKSYKGTFNMPTLRPLSDLVPVMLFNDSDMTANNATMTWFNGTVPLIPPYGLMACNRRN
jgi:hypothetical protein